MAEFYEVLEIADQSHKGTGKFRFTVRTDEPESGPYGLCEHVHDTREEARECPDAVKNTPRFMRPKSSEELLKVRINRLITQYKLQQPDGKIEIVILTKDQNDTKIIQCRVGDDLGGSTQGA